jgi:hypothetical protein
MPAAGTTMSPPLSASLIERFAEASRTARRTSARA